jgi:hypothetical protein
MWKHPVVAAQLHDHRFPRRRGAPLTGRKKGDAKGEKEGGSGTDITAPRVIDTEALRR